MLAMLVGMLCLFLPVSINAQQAQIDIEETGISNDGPYPNDEFRALAHAQLDAIALMCNHYLTKYGEYPKDLYELQASEFWVASIDNLLTGLPIQQMEYSPTGADFVHDPIGSVIPQPSGSYQGATPRMPQTGTGNGSGNQNDNNQDNQGNNGQSNTFTYISVIPPRLDPSRISAAEPGNVLYYPVSDSALQLIMWMNNDVYVDYFQTSPLENDVIRYKLVREINPTDRSILTAAILLEEVIPRNYSYWQFYTGHDPLLPMDIPSLKWDQREEMYGILRIQPMNALLNAKMEMVKEYTIGMVADVGNEGVPPVYCMHGNRLRTLRELIDPKYLNEHKEEVINRERMFFGK